MVKLRAPQHPCISQYCMMFAVASRDVVLENRPIKCFKSKLNAIISNEFEVNCFSSFSTLLNRFPKDDNLCAKWAEVIQRHNGHPIVQNASYVCSLHFPSDSGPNAVPTIFPPKPSYCIPPVIRTRTPTADDRQMASTSIVADSNKPSDAKKMRPADEIMFVENFYRRAISTE